MTVEGLRVEEMLAGGTSRNLVKKRHPTQGCLFSPRHCSFHTFLNFQGGGRKAILKKCLRQILEDRFLPELLVKKEAAIFVWKGQYKYCAFHGHTISIWGTCPVTAQEDSHRQQVNRWYVHWNSSQVETSQRPLNLPQQRGFGQQVHKLTLCYLPQRISLLVLVMRLQALHMLGECSNAEWHPQPYLLRI